MSGHRHPGLRYTLAGLLGRGLVEALLRTARFEVDGGENLDAARRMGPAVIHVLWHGRLLPLAWHRRDEGVVALVSRSADGEYLTRLLERLGFRTVRGSSSRGASASLRQLVRHARQGHPLALTPDGPRGPRERMKPGALLAAQLSGSAVLPTASAARPAWWFEGWDRFLVPRPFAKVRVVYGPPIAVPRDLDEGGMAALNDRVEAALRDVTARADAAVAAGGRP